MTQGIQCLVVVPMLVSDRQGGLNATGQDLGEKTYDQISMDFLSGLEADLTRIRFWKGLYNIVQDELDVPRLELSSDHRAELDRVRRVENEGMSVDDGNLFGLWGRADKGTGILKWVERALLGTRLSTLPQVLDGGECECGEGVGCHTQSDGTGANQEDILGLLELGTPFPHELVQLPGRAWEIEWSRPM